MLTAVGVKLEESFQSRGCVCCGGGRALVCRVVQQQGEVRKQCDAGLTGGVGAEEHRLKYHQAVIPVAVHGREDNTRLQWGVQPSCSSQRGHCLRSALEAALDLNRDLGPENTSSQTGLKLLLTFCAWSLGTTSPRP